MKVQLVSKTAVEPDYAAHLLAQEDVPEEFADVLASPEGLMAYIARVSSPNQTNPAFDRLLTYCMQHGHWSVFEMVDAAFEIETSRALAHQLTRHHSFRFQEFSQRYSQVSTFEKYQARRQDTKDRQNSIDDMSESTKEWFSKAQDSVWKLSFDLYSQAIGLGIAKEQARFLLPESATTKLYAKGSIRSWIHFMDVRCLPSTQKEHRDIADAIKAIFVDKFPVVAKAKGWIE